MGLHVLSECEQCCERFRASGGPPCNKDLMTGRFRIVLQPKQSIGNGMLPQCPFIAGAPEILGWVKSTQPVSSLGAEDWAKRSIEEMRAKLKAKPAASDSELGVSDLRRAQMGSKENFLVVFASASRPGYDCLFLRPLKNMSEHAQFFEANGLALPPGQRSKNQTQQNTISDKRKPHMFPPVTPSGEAKGTFVPWQQVEPTAQHQGVDSFINWDAIQYGYEKSGGKSIGVQVNSPYGLGPVMNGCHNVETAFNNAADPNQQYFGSAFAKILAKNGKTPNGSWWPVALQVLGQLGVTVGIMGGAAAVGFIGGALAKRYFLLPGLSTGQCAVGGASLAVALTSKIMDGLFIMDVAKEANAQGDNLKAGVQTAWAGNVAQASGQIAEVLAALVFAVMQAMLLKLGEGIASRGVALLELLRTKLRTTRIGDSPAALKWAQEEIHPKLPDPPARVAQASERPLFEEWDVPVKEHMNAAREFSQRSKALENTDPDLALKYRLESLEHYIEANRGLQWQKWMSGHAKVVFELARFEDRTILNEIRGKQPSDVIAMFQREGITITEPQARIIIQNAEAVRPGELTKAAMNHDYKWTNPGAKRYSAVSEGMKYPHKALTPKQLEELNDIQMTATDGADLEQKVGKWVDKNRLSPVFVDYQGKTYRAYAPYSANGKGRLITDEKGNSCKIFDDPKDVPPDAVAKNDISPVAKWWAACQGENIERAAETTGGIYTHNVWEPHHNEGNPGLNPNVAELLHGGVDSWHSKIMGGRPYQAQQDIDAPVKFFQRDTDADKAPILLGQYATKRYLKSSNPRFDRGKIVNCYQLSTLPTRLEQL
jgi:hypothetical protein